MNLKCDTTLMNLLREAIANSCDEDGWASLSNVGKIINNQSSLIVKIMVIRSWEI